MKDWLLYCILCSLIYAMAVHAYPIADSEMTAELIFYNGERVPVRDCAIFIPNLGSETNTVRKNLKALGFNAQISNEINLEKIEFKDNHGHAVNEFHTNFARKIGYYGRNTVLMSLQGHITKRTRKSELTLKLHRLGAQEDAIASSTYIGVASDRKLSVKGFPRCQPKSYW